MAFNYPALPTPISVANGGTNTTQGFARFNAGSFFKAIMLDAGTSLRGILCAPAATGTVVNVTDATGPILDFGNATIAGLSCVSLANTNAIFRVGWGTTNTIVVEQRVYLASTGDLTNVRMWWGSTDCTNGTVFNAASPNTASVYRQCAAARYDTVNGDVNFMLYTASAANFETKDTGVAVTAGRHTLVWTISATSVSLSVDGSTPVTNTTYLPANTTDMQYLHVVYPQAGATKRNGLCSWSVTVS